MGQSRKLRFAQAGVAAIHASMYRDTLLMMDDEIELVGFWDPEPEVSRVRIKPDAEHIPFYDSIGELLEKAQPDAVLVSGYCRDMPGWMLEVAEAGVHVWAEKPFAVHSDQLLPVAEAMRRHNLAFSCGYSWRFEPLSLLIKETNDAGLLGKPYSVEMRLLTSSVKNRDPNHWMFDPALSGGGILNWLGCHWFDLMRFWTGSEVTKVAAIEANVSGAAIAVEDAAMVSLQFANGMVGSLHTGNFLPSGNEIYFGLRGSDGAVTWRHEDGSCTIHSTNPAWEAAPERTFAMPSAKLAGYGGAGMRLMRAFAAEIRGEGASGYTIDDAIKSLQIIEAAHEAARTGRTVAPADATAAVS
ncbi:MAG: Gfo/Idh/MocA family protein [Thermomicrobiales bacterium]